MGYFRDISGNLRGMGSKVLSKEHFPHRKGTAHIFVICADIFFMQKQLGSRSPPNFQKYQELSRNFFFWQKRGNKAFCFECVYYTWSPSKRFVLFITIGSTDIGEYSLRSWTSSRIKITLVNYYQYWYNLWF